MSARKFPLPTRFTRTLLALALAGQIGLCLAGSTVRIELPAQDLSSALLSLATQSGVQLVFSPDTVGHAKAPAVRGEMSVEQALDKLLEGSGLEFHQQSERNFSIRRQSGAMRVLPVMVVTATRTERAADRVPASVSVLSGSELQAKSKQNVYEALRGVESLDFGYSASVPQQVAPNIRGVGGSFAGSTTQVLVDGQSNDSVVSSVLGHGGLNFTSMQDVERVEIVRGPVSALYGPGVIGGVINVIPKRWQGGPGVEFNLGYGSHDTRSLGVAVGTRGEKFDVRLSAHDTRSDGFKPIPVRDPFDQIDYAPRGWSDTKLSLLGGYRPDARQEITLAVQTYATRSDSLGGHPAEYHDLDGRSATLGYALEISEQTQFKASLRTSKLEQKFGWDEEDWNGDIGNLAFAYGGGRESHATGLTLQLDTQPLAENQLTLGYSHDVGDFRSYGSATFESEDTVDAVFVQDEQRLGRVILSGGLRYDRLDFSPEVANGVPKNGSASVDNVLTPRLGTRYLFNEQTSVYASYGQGYLPALNSFKFVQPSTTRVDNPNLDPETSTTYELGANHRYEQGNLRASVYRTEYKDKIALGTDTVSGLRQWQNLALVKVDGLELAYEGRLGKHWLPFANFAYTKARNYATESAPSTLMTRVPARKFNLGLTYQAGEQWSGTLSARKVSEQYFNAISAAQRADGYSVVDFNLDYRLPVAGRQWHLRFAANNLGDEKYSEWNVGEYADGRNFSVGLDGRF